MAVSRRGKRGSRPLDASQLRELTKDDRIWCALGVVRAREGAGSHWEKDDDLGDVLVNVDLGPDGIDVWCRLGGFHGSRGMFLVPAPDSEVVVTQLAGDPREMPTIVASLSSGSLPSDADADMLIVTNGKKVRVVSTEEDVEVTSGSSKVVKVNGDDYSLPKTETLLTSLAALSQVLTTVLSGASVDVGIVAAMALVPAPPILIPGTVTPYATNSAALAGLLASATPYKSDKAKNG